MNQSQQSFLKLIFISSEKFGNETDILVTESNTACLSLLVPSFPRFLRHLVVPLQENMDLMIIPLWQIFVTNTTFTSYCLASVPFWVQNSLSFQCWIMVKFFFENISKWQLSSRVKLTDAHASQSKWGQCEKLRPSGHTEAKAAMSWPPPLRPAAVERHCWLRCIWIPEM